MNKITKFPSALISGDYTASSLVLDDGSIIDQCIVTAGERGTFFLEQHLLYVVLGGSVKLTCGRQSWTVGKNQMILLRKAHSVTYEKQGSPETGLFESQLFAINDDLLKDFLTTQKVNIPPMTEEFGAQVSPMSERLVSYCWSLSPYFNDPSLAPPEGDGAALQRDGLLKKYLPADAPAAPTREGGCPPRSGGQLHVVYLARRTGLPLWPLALQFQARLPEHLRRATCQVD